MASALICKAGLLGVDILFSATTAKDVYYLVGKLLRAKACEGGQSLCKGDALAIRSLAWSCVANMGEIGTMVGMDASDMWLAEKYREIHDDFEDDLVLAAMERCGADFLVTNDERLLRDAPRCRPERCRCPEVVGGRRLLAAAAGTGGRMAAYNQARLYERRATS